MQINIVVPAYHVGVYLQQKWDASLKFYTHIMPFIYIFEKAYETR